jgi:hypothetical protein
VVTAGRLDREFDSAHELSRLLRHWVLFTVPFGYIVTRSFQKHGKLTRPIMAHFLYDAILFTISILH